MRMICERVSSCHFSASFVCTDKHRLAGCSSVFVAGDALAPDQDTTPEATPSNDTATTTITTNNDPLANLPIQTLRLQTNQSEPIALDAEQLALHALFWAHSDNEADTQLFALGEGAIVVLNEDLDVQRGWLVGRLNARAYATNNDRSLLAVLADTGYVRLWRISDGNELGQVRVNETVSTIAFSVDDKRMLLVGDATGYTLAYTLEETGLMETDLPTDDALPTLIMPPDDMTSAQHPTQDLSARIVGDASIALWQGDTQQTQVTIEGLPARRNVQLAPSYNDTGCSILEDSCER
jgi:hypothetical protein